MPIIINFFVNSNQILVTVYSIQHIVSDLLNSVIFSGYSFSDLLTLAKINRTNPKLSMP